MRSKLILAIIGAAFIAALAVAGISHYRGVATETKCVQQMGMLWDAARSHMLQVCLSVDAPISPADLRQFMGGPFSTNMHCPLGQSGYQTFTFREGPKCPNSAAHNEALGKMVANWPAYKTIVERQDRETPWFTTNQAAITNGRMILAALRSGDAERRPRI